MMKSSGLSFLFIFMYVSRLTNGISSFYKENVSSSNVKVKPNTEEILNRLNKLEWEIIQLRSENFEIKKSHREIQERIDLFIVQNGTHIAASSDIDEPNKTHVLTIDQSAITSAVEKNPTSPHKSKRSVASQNQPSGDDSRTNSWSKLQISPDELGSMRYYDFAISIYPHARNGNKENSGKKYFYAPIAMLDHHSARSEYNNSTRRVEMRFRIKMWDEALEKDVVEYISDRELYNVSQAQIGVLPFEKVMLVSSQIFQPVYSLSKEWKNYQRHQYVSFTFVCQQIKDCHQLANNMKTRPDNFHHLGLLFNMASQTSENRDVIIRVESIFRGEMMTKMIQRLPESKDIFISAADEKKLLQETSSNVMLDIYDESSAISSKSEDNIQEILRKMLVSSRQVVTTSSAKIWDSVFWDKENYRPDRTAKTFNEVYKKLDTKQQKKLASSFQNVNKLGYGASANLLGLVSAEVKLDIDFSRAGAHSSEYLNKLYQENKDNVGWDGEKFIPKALNLSRINVGDLRDKQNYFEKKVRVAFATSSLSLSVNIQDKGQHSTIVLPTSSSDGFVQSCRDLYNRGHRFSAMHVVKNGTKYDLVYCDLTKSSSQSGFETRVGQVDVKSSPVYFYVQRNSYYGKAGTTIPFELERLNVGGAMNLTSGVFTAPRNGVYFFAFSAIEGGGTGAWVQIRLNGKDIIGKALGSGSNSSYDTLSLQSTLKLNKGDQISLLLRQGTIHDDSYHYTHFTGLLLEED